MRELQGQGVTFLFISHHLQEVYEICQAVTVLRDAPPYRLAPVAELPKDTLIEAMTGEQVNFGVRRAAGPDLPAERSRWRSRSRHLCGDDFADVSFTVRRGEVVGISGATQQRPDRRRRGDRRARPPVAGTIRHRRGGAAAPATCRRRWRSGSAACRRTGTTQGLVLPQSVADNTTMTIADKLGPAGFIAAAGGRRR